MLISSSKLRARCLYTDNEKTKINNPKNKNKGAYTQIAR
jgi:hypothetical protein